MFDKVCHTAQASDLHIHYGTTSPQDNGIMTGWPCGGGGGRVCVCMRGGVCMVRDKVVKGCEAELAGAWPQWSGCAWHSDLDVTFA